MLYADGKVVTSAVPGQPDTRTLNKTTGELRTPRFEADAGLHVEGTGETAWGLTFVLVAVRTTDRHGRIILDTDSVPDTGEKLFTELPRIRTGRKAYKIGTYRWYNRHRLPEPLGGGVIVVRLHGNDDDKVRKFNRTENVRAIPRGDPAFRALYPRRNDAESINRAFDGTLWLRRARAVGADRQRLNLLMYALAMNALAPHRHRRSSSDPPLPLAA